MSICVWVTLCVFIFRLFVCLINGFLSIERKRVFLGTWVFLVFPKEIFAFSEHMRYIRYSTAYQVTQIIQSEASKQKPLEELKAAED